MDTFTVIYFRCLQNWTMSEQYTVRLYGHFWGDLFSQNYLSHEYHENKLLLKINWFTVIRRDIFWAVNNENVDETNH